MLVVLGTVGVALPRLWAEGEKAVNVLRKSLEKRDGQSYEGERTIERSPRGRKAPRVRELVQREPGRRERIEVLEPAKLRGNLIVSDGHVRWRHFPATNTVWREPLRPAQHAREIERRWPDLLDRNFVLAVTSEKVIGRPSHMIEVRDRRGDRVVQKMWLDSETGVELKSVRYRPDDSLEYQWYFTSIKYSPGFPPGTFEFDPTGKKRHDQPALPPPVDAATAKKQTGCYIFHPAEGPMGYQPMPFYTVQRRRDARVIVVLRFHNGLDHLSLFQIKEPPGAAPVRPKDADVFRAGPYRFVIKGPQEAREALHKAVLDDLRDKGILPAAPVMPNRPR